jgi:hypothetical protein
MPWKLKDPLNKRPPNGVWRIKDDGLEFEGESPEDCAEKLESYRHRHSQPVGNPIQEVINYNCELYPHLGRRYEEEETKDEPERVMGSVPESARLHAESLSCAPQAFAQDSEIRKNICLDCPFNIKQESQEIEYRKMAIQITSGKFSHEPDLGICQIHGHDNRIAVWVKDPKIAEKEKQPETCWVR